MDLSVQSHDVKKEAFSVGSGEMAALIRAKDWSKTPLGPTKTWPPALHMMTSFLLANRFPLMLWWGPDQISIYNDAYRPMLGMKHPDALGLPVRECWSEIWDVLQPLILTPLHGGPPTWSEDLELGLRRHGFLEEAHFALAYSPVPDATAPNGVGGVLATVHETTRQVIAERRNALLRDLGERLAHEAKTAEDACRGAADAFAKHLKDVPFALLYLIDEDGPTARLAASAGIAMGEPASPSVIGLNDEGAQTWPLAMAFRRESIQMVEDLRSRFAVVPAGVYPEPPELAVVLPVPSNLAHHLAGLLVVGVSPRLELDDPYWSFLDLVTSQLATAIANARAYEEERRRARALANLDRVKMAFFSNVSHEFRTPLTLLLGPVEEGLQDTSEPLSPKQRARHETVHRNALRLLKLVNSLLDFSRIEAGRSQASYEPTDIAILTAEVASTFRSLVERAGLKLIIDCPPLVEPVFVDRQMWEKIVLNLVSNAFKFTFRGEISVRVEADPRSTRLVVRDTGIGIEEKHLPHVFERFFRVEEARGRTYEGTGIGLSLVLELARLHGGCASVTSERGKGATFTVTVPAGTAHLPQERIRTARKLELTAVLGQGFVEEASGWIGETPREPTEADAMELTACDEAASSTRLLVADDNADMRAYLERLLRPLGTVELVTDGRQALAAIHQRMPDLVLSDVMMPNVDGLGLLHALRMDPRTRRLPVVLLSARSGEESRLEGADLGADDYVVKPFSARELQARVRSQLALARQRRDYEDALLKSEQRFRSLVTASCDAVYRMDPDWSEMRRLDGREFIADTTAPTGTWLQRYIHPDDQPHVLKVIEEAIRTKSVFELEHRVVRPDGSLGWAFSRAVPSLDANGEIIEWVGMASDVTTRKQAEQSLAADLTALQRMHELSARGLATTGPQPLLQEIVDIAVALLRADNGTLSLLEGDPLRVVAHHGHGARFLEFFRAAEGVASASGEAIRRGERVVVEDVERSPLFAGTASLAILREAGVRAVQSTPMLTRTGRPLGVLTTHWAKPYRPDEHELWRLDLLVRQATDLIEHAQMETVLRQSEERFRAALKGSPATVSSQDSGLRYTWVYNPWPGFSVETMLGKRDDELFSPRDAEALMAVKRQVLASGVGRRDEVVIRPSNATGDEMVQDVTTEPLHDPSGAVVGVISVAVDISERRRAQDLLRAKRFNDVLIDTANVLIIGSNGHGETTVFNKRAEKVSGYSRAELLTRDWLKVLIPRDRFPNTWNELSSLPNGRLPDTWETPILTKSGEERIIGWRNSLVNDSDDVGTISFGIDLTDQRRAEEHLHQLQKMESIGTLAGGIAHDFNNILCGIMNGLSLWEVTQGDDPRRLADIHDVKMLVEQGAGLCKQLLGFARRGKFVPKPLDLAQVAEATCNVLGHTRRDITIRYDFAARLPAVLMDRTQLEQVMLNLFLNAAHAMPSGGCLALCAEVTTVTGEQGRLHDVTPGRFVKLAFADTGVGMSAATKARIFEPFFTTKPAGQGTGLGLASVYGIIKNHGGMITVESEPGQGTTFTLFVPAIEGGSDALAAEPRPNRGVAPAVEEPAAAASSNAMAVSPAAQRKRSRDLILVVDDEQQLLKFCARLVGAMGYEVLAASDGREAIELVRAHKDRLSLVILDMIMPEISGAETFDALREIAPELKVLLASGDSIDGQAQEILGRGCNDFIQKPFDGPTLSAKIQSLL